MKRRTFSFIINSRQRTLLALMILFSVAGLSQAPVVKQRGNAQEKEGTLFLNVKKAREATSRQVNLPGINELDAIRIISRKEILQKRQQEILRLCQDPAMPDSTYKRYKTELTKSDSAIRVDNALLGLLKDTIENTRVANYIKYLKGDRTWGAIFFPASPIHIATPTDTCALYYNSRYKGIRSQAFYSFIYGTESNWNALNNVAIQAQGKQASLYAEVGSGLIGPVRIGLSTLVTKSDTLKIGEARQRLTNGGGNLNLEAQFPLFYLHKKWECTYVFASLRTSGDIPAFGTNTDKTTGSINAGFEFYQDISTSNKQFNFFLSARTSWIKGLNNLFYENLGLYTRKRFFPYGQLSFGLTLFNSYRISFIVPMYGPASSLLKVPAVFGGQVLPVISD